MAPEIQYTDLTREINRDMEIVRQSRKRVEILDELRGFCVLLMMAYHFCYILYSYFGVNWANTVFTRLGYAQPVVAAIFILISGITARLSRDNVRQGAILLTCGLGISLLTLVLFPQIGIAQAGVWFGVLHMLGISKILYALCKRLLEKIPVLLGALPSLALFGWFSTIGEGKLSLFGAFTVQLPENLYEGNMLAAFGIHNSEFVSWDYLPLLPYFFMFLCGTFLGKWFTEDRMPEFCYKVHCTLPGRIGRNALIYFILHIPVFYGIAYLVHRIILYSEGSAQP